jgi:hypothetical protein
MSDEIKYKIVVEPVKARFGKIKWRWCILYNASPSSPYNYWDVLRGYGFGDPGCYYKEKTKQEAINIATTALRKYCEKKKKLEEEEKFRIENTHVETFTCSQLK